MLVGFNVDLARAICLELNTSCDIKARPWEELFAGLKNGDADAVIAAHKVTASALKEVDFTDRYFHTPGRFAGRKESPQVEMSPGGLDGKRIAVARGTAHEAFLKAFFRDSPLVIYENADLAREALAAGKADFLFDDGNLARLLAERDFIASMLRDARRPIPGTEVLRRRYRDSRPEERSRH